MEKTERKSRQQIHGIFYPRSVAVVGTNRGKGTVPYDIFYNILTHGFKGTVYPVSPRERSIAGVKAYRYVIDIEDEIDMAVVVFPSTVSHMAMEQIGQKGIKSAIVISAGFREIGEAGLKRELEMKRIADRYGVSFVGPNCLGVINTDPECSFNASFARQMPARGNIAFLSQSGALCTAVLDYARAMNIGFSKFVSFGNKADISEIDLLYYLKDDPETKVILLYLEEITEGKDLMEAARQIIAESGKPLLLLKSGRTREGASAAVSHTGSLAGSDEVCDAAFRQAGIIRCDTVEDMFNYALALAYQPLPEGRKIAIITNAGGPGVLATDRAVQEGLALARFSEETVSVLKKSLPHTANLQNPVDLIGDAKKDRYGAAVTAVLADRGVDGALIILTPQSMTDIRSIAEEICSIEWRFEKPVYASFMGQADVAEGVEILQRRHIPHYRLPEDMCQAFARAYRFDRIHRRALCKTDVHQDVEADSAEEVLQEAVQEGVERDTEQLSMTAAFDLLEAYRLPILPYRMAASRDQAAAFSEELGFPVVLKIFCREIIHKSDIGGVALNLSSRQEVIRGYDRIVENLRRWNPDAEAEGVLVQRAAAPGEELIVGVRRDPSFGPIVLVGLGGIYAEIFRDVSMRVSPIDEKEGGRMVEELRAFPLLNGARGRPRRDIDSLLHVILQVDRLAQEHREICELDINPLIVGFEGGGCVVADVRIMIESLERRNV